MQLEVYNNQEAVGISAELLEKLADCGREAMLHALNYTRENSVLHAESEVEVSIVDDDTIAQVHVDFMHIPGATDVITFDYGEIVISAETASIYGAEFGNSFERELMLYIVHGLLHLAGHEDAESLDRERMEKIQFEILEKVW